MSELPQHEAAARDALHERFPEAAALLDAYVEILGTKGLEWGLLGPREGDKLWSRHVANSLALNDVIANGLDVADIGSGAGLPGLPLAIARPDLRITLVEPLLRRATFLEETVEELGLGDRVVVRRARAEELKATFDVVTARAVTALDKLVRWTSHLFLPDGALLALKGSSAQREVFEAGSRLTKAKLSAEVLEIRAAAGIEGTFAIRVSRER